MPCAATESHSDNVCMRLNSQLFRMQADLQSREALTGTATESATKHPIFCACTSSTRQLLCTCSFCLCSGNDLAKSLAGTEVRYSCCCRLASSCCAKETASIEGKLWPPSAKKRVRVGARNQGNALQSPEPLFDQGAANITSAHPQQIKSRSCRSVGR